ncbi:outer membrane beta-barrel protein [Undibacterium terreum]|uniref:Membrane protein n=1 Tax=Undibacterium terreum TaxID=1224302 RepID=A0A916U447_9BURK|nr:outer membrane beta-barrel protein [Undibacterium terreum]GGC59590.1 membrane protein [Undibacterium terreum]
MINSKVLVLLAATALTASAYAEDLYVVGSVGQSKFNGANQSTSDAILNNSGGVVQSSDLKDTDTGFKLLVGHQFTPNFALEGGYVDLGKSKYSAALSDGAVSANFKSSGAVIDAVGILPLSNEFSLFGKGGLYYGKTSLDVSNSSAAAGTAYSGLDSTWKTSLNYGAGLSYAINKNLSVRGEYERFARLGDNIETGGKSNVNLLSVGLVAKF